jgi:hypothetical protein
VQPGGERGAAPELAAQAKTASPALASEPTRRASAREPSPAAAAHVRPRAQALVQDAVASTSAVKLPAVPREPEQAPGELVLMRRALERLNAGDPHGAIEQLGQHAARFPNGVMTEERDGLRAVALCKGDDPARGSAAAQSFLRLYPDSPLGARVRSACKDGAQ